MYQNRDIYTTPTTFISHYRVFINHYRGFIKADPFIDVPNGIQGSLEEFRWKSEYWQESWDGFMQMGVAINERLTSAQILKSWESTKKKVDPTYLLEEYHQAFRKALRKKQSEEWDKLMNRDIVGMRVRDKYTDFKLALFTMHNDDISDEEAERRLETLPEGAIDSANVWIREFQLPRVEWEIEEFLDDLPIEVWSEWQDRFQEAREALEELLKKHLEQVRLRTQEWFVETKKKWGELLHEATQVDMSFESRFGRLTELKIIAGKT